MSPSIDPYHKEFDKFLLVIGPSINAHHEEFDKFPRMTSLSFDLYHGRFDKFPLMLGPSHLNMWWVQQISIHAGVNNVMQVISLSSKQFVFNHV